MNFVVVLAVGLLRVEVFMCVYFFVCLFVSIDRLCEHLTSFPAYCTHENLRQPVLLLEKEHRFGL